MISFRRVWFAVALVTLVASAAGGASAGTPGGTQISNTVTATYADGNGTPFGTVSNTVVATVVSVSGVGVTPNENGCNPQTDGYAVGSNVTKTFTVTNSSNISDAYTLTATTTGGTISSLALVSAGQAPVPFANGATSPTVAPGGTLQIQVTLATTSVPVGTNISISLQAKSTSTVAANGQASAVASQCAIAVGKAAVAGPGGATSQVSKLVDGKPFEAVAPGTTVQYTIAFENYGGVAAQNAVFTDAFPAGIVPNLASLQLNGTPVTTGATLSGQTLTVQLGALAPLVPYTLTVTALVSTSTTIGTTYINTATISANNAATATTSPAAVLAGSGNIVYDGYVGASQPVGGASVTLLGPSGTPIVPGGPGIAPNVPDANPFVTGSNGAYAFGLSPNQIGPITYTIVITAPGYLSRRIQVTLTPAGTGDLYTVVITALDGQPLAVPGGFALTPGPVTLVDVSDLFGNIPLFRAQAITIVKNVDRTVASAGDRLVYTLTFANVSTPLGAATLVDTLPAGVAYASGTSLVDGVHQEPVVAGRTLTWTIPTLVKQHTIVYATVVVPGVTPGSTLTNVATISASPTNAPGVKLSATSSVETLVIDGAFSDRTIVTGRVFVDRTKDGYFHRGDVGIPNVRIYLEDGESVTTDSNGRYSFPGVRPGMHVLKLDVTTLPAGTHAYPERNYDSQKSIRRLLHGVFDGGIIEDINFAIEAVQ